MFARNTWVSWRAFSSACRAFRSALALLAARLTLNTTPISPSSSKRLVPPEEKKGRLMPVLGMVLVTTATLKKNWKPIWAMTPTTRRQPARSGAFTAT